MDINFLYLIIFNIIAFTFLYKLSFKFNLIDKPNQRKTHLYPTPLIGGLIIYSSLIFGIYCFEFPEKINLIIVYSGLILLTGFLDDFYDLNISTRLVLIFLSCFLLINEGLLINDIGSFQNSQVITLGAFATIFTILSVGGLTNAFNFLDGIDGLLLSQVIISHLLLLTYSFFFTNELNFLNYYIVVFIICSFGILYNFGIFLKKIYF